MLDFVDGFDPELDRNRILSEAARYLDIDAGALSGEGPHETSDIGDLVRAFAEDEASLGCPQLYPVRRDAIAAAATGMPVSTRALTSRARFFLVSFPVSLYSAVGRGFNRLEVKAAFNPGANGVHPTTFDVLPDRQWTTKAKIGAALSAGVNADLKFVVGLPEELSALTGLPVSGSAGASLNNASKLVLGPFSWSLGCPEIEHSSPELDHVFWRLNGAKFVREQDPGLRVLLRVPDEIVELRITGQMKARRYYNLFDHKLVEATKSLPDALKSFFSEKGTPIFHADEWDLSEQLDAA